MRPILGRWTSSCGMKCSDISFVYRRLSQTTATLFKIKSIRENVLRQGCLYFLSELSKVLDLQYFLKRSLTRCVKLMNLIIDSRNEMLF